MKQINNYCKKNKLIILTITLYIFTLTLTFILLSIIITFNTDVKHSLKQGQLRYCIIKEVQDKKLDRVYTGNNVYNTQAPAGRFIIKKDYSNNVDYKYTFRIREGQTFSYTDTIFDNKLSVIDSGYKIIVINKESKEQEYILYAYCLK